MDTRSFDADTPHVELMKRPPDRMNNGSHHRPINALLSPAIRTRKRTLVPLCGIRRLAQWLRLACGIALAASCSLATAQQQPYVHSPNALGIAKSVQVNNVGGRTSGVGIVELMPAVSAGHASIDLSERTVIKKINNTSIRTPEALEKEMRNLKAGTEVRITFTDAGGIGRTTTKKVKCIDAKEANAKMEKAEKARLSRVYTLSDGRKLTLQQIEAHNKALQLAGNRWVVSLDFEEAQEANIAMSALRDVNEAYRTNGTKGREFAAAARRAVGAAKFIDKFLDVMGDLIRVCDDGSAATQSEVWGHALNTFVER